MTDPQRPAAATDRVPPRALDFGGRGASLPTLPARRPTPAGDDVAQASPGPTAPVGTATGQRASRRRRPAAEREPTGPVSDGVGVHLGVGLLERLRKYHADRPGSTYTSIALDAVEACASQEGGLAGLFAAAPRRSGDLFQGRQPKIVHHPDGRTQITLRPGPEDRATLDQLAETTPGCPNRSALIAGALEAYLP